MLKILVPKAWLHLQESKLYNNFGTVYDDIKRKWSSSHRPLISNRKRFLKKIQEQEKRHATSGLTENHSLRYTVLHLHAEGYTVQAPEVFRQRSLILAARIRSIMKSKLNNRLRSNLAHSTTFTKLKHKHKLFKYVATERCMGQYVKY